MVITAHHPLAWHGRSSAATDDGYRGVVAARCHQEAGMTDPADILGSDPRPAFFLVGNPVEAGLEPPPDRYGQSVRTWVRALAGMQKEALVVNGMTGRAWRLVSDEGP